MNNAAHDASLSNNDLPVVVGLGPVATEIVGPVLAGHARFISDPNPRDLETAVGAIVRAAVTVDADLLQQMPRLRVIARTGVGTDSIDLNETAARNIPVIITPGSNTRAVAEGTLAQVLHLVKRLGPLHLLVQENRWTDRDQYPIGDLDDTTIGIIGYGRIGQRVGELAKGFGMEVRAFDPHNPPPNPERVDDLVSLLEQASVLTLHAPLTPETHHLINTDAIGAMRPGTVLINSGRGALIDLDAAFEALNDGTLGGLGLDVYTSEPPEHHPVFDHPNVLLTPHVMGLSKRATRATFIDAARGVVDVLTGQRPRATAT